MTIQEIAAEVAEKRQKLQELADAYNAKKRQFETTWAELAGDVSAAADEVKDAESRLRDAGLVAYAADPSTKKLPCGLGVRVTSKLDYDPSTAFVWAVSHKMCLSLDSRAFEKVAKVTPLDFVETVEIVTVTLPSDSAKLLA